MLIHDFHIWWCTGVGKWVMSPPVMAPAKYSAFCGLCDVVSALASANINHAEFAAFEANMIEKLVVFENEFPITDHAIVFHLLIEIYGSIQILGPCFVYWTYFFERMIGSMTRQIHSRARPEANLVAIHRRDIALNSLSSHPRLFEGLDPQIAQHYRTVSPYAAKPSLPWEFPDLARHQPSLALTESQYLQIHDVGKSQAKQNQGCLPWCMGSGERTLDHARSRWKEKTKAYESLFVEFR
jgi:hypothetical protein